jgi:hypothetical protein
MQETSSVPHQMHFAGNPAQALPDQVDFNRNLHASTSSVRAKELQHWHRTGTSIELYGSKPDAGASLHNTDVVNRSEHSFVGTSRLGMSLQAH